MKSINLIPANLFGSFINCVLTAGKRGESVQVNESAIGRLFDRHWSEATPIEFNRNWANGTGYFDHAVRGEHAPVLKAGEIVCAKAPLPDNRKILIIGTPCGNVVLFRRYTTRHDMFATNTAYEFDRAFGKNFCYAPETCADLEKYLGKEGPDGYPNAGLRLATSTDPEVLQWIEQYNNRSEEE